MGSSDHRRIFANQNYAQLKKRCTKAKTLFTDPVFPPSNASLFLDQDRDSDIVWLRPGELAEDPHLFVEGASPNDVTQGILGNCWFVSACSALTHNIALLDKVIPHAEKQEWSEDNVYCGIFRFRFWRFGEWVEIVVDDLLPTREGKLLFARSKTPNEFWSALLEKAFAKLYGCYENLVGGHLADALQDVSSGVAETISMVKTLKLQPGMMSLILFERLRSAFDNAALVIAAIAAKTKDEVEETLDCGLVKGHAYAVTAVRFIELDNKNRLPESPLEKQRMIRLQNPWGEKEWNGPWSDGSPEWEQVTEASKKELGITVDEDGEFWMTWESFSQFFTDISVCQLFNTSGFSLAKRYEERVFFGVWKTNGVRSGAPGDMAGGCINFPASFTANPQYMFDVPSEQNEFYFALTQREVGEGTKKREPFVCIGMHVLRVEANRLTRLHQATDSVETSDYVNARSVFLHLVNMKPGRYVILPTTFAPKEEADYMFRAYSSNKLLMRELTRHIEGGGWCWQGATHVTRIHVVQAELTQEPAAEYYCVVSNGSKKVRSHTYKTSREPKWNEQFIFYSRSPRQKFFFEVWRELPERNMKIGTFDVVIYTDNDRRELVRGWDGGSVRLVISAYDDPLYL